jgi:hypothetical protein
MYRRQKVPTVLPGISGRGMSASFRGRASDVEGCGVVKGFLLVPEDGMTNIGGGRGDGTGQ